METIPHQVQHVLDQSGSEVIDEQNDFIRCPGEGRHTTPNALRDCKLYLNPGNNPRAFCQHQSCAADIAALNQDLAKLGGQPGGNFVKPSGDRVTKASHVTALAEEALPEILRAFRWPAASILTDSPQPIDTPEPDQWHHVLDLFDDSDVLWIGRDVFDTGNPNYACRFRRVRHWLREKSCPGPFICPNTFKEGVHSRSSLNLSDTRFLVIESDVLNRDEVGAVFRFLVHRGFRLRLVVDTAGKSLHGWFDYPEGKHRKGLDKLLPALGCDAALFNPSQPVRLAGGQRDGKYQHLLYLDDQP